MEPSVKKSYVFVSLPDKEVSCSQDAVAVVSLFTTKDSCFKIFAALSLEALKKDSIFPKEYRKAPESKTTKHAAVNRRIYLFCIENLIEGIVVYGQKIEKMPMWGIQSFRSGVDLGLDEKMCERKNREYFFIISKR